jgi:hypothetical protein
MGRPGDDGGACAADDQPRGSRSVSRRRLLGVAGVAAVSATAGCGTVVNRLPGLGDGYGAGRYGQRGYGR